MTTPSNTQMIAPVLAWAGMACWMVCFWWMHRISARQEAMLQELHKVIKRIEELSRAEHDMLRQVHPNVEQIKESVKDVAEAVSAEDPKNS